jgi:dTDP-4-amino-4,6-dideoxygalactose transaminase
MAGLPSDMESILKIARNHDLPVLEDAAHAIGARYKGTRVGSLGDVTAFSFFSNKNLSVGEGGAITTNDDSIAERLKLLRSHGLTKSTWSRHFKKDQESFDQLYDMVMLGYNYRITEINAALGLVQLRKLDSFNARRKELFRKFKDLMNDQPLKFQTIPEDMESSYHILPAIFPKGTRPKIRAELAKQGIGTSIHYTPIHKFSYYQEIGFENLSLPIAEDIGSRVITLPLHQNLSDDDMDYIAKHTREILRTYS